MRQKLYQYLFPVTEIYYSFKIITGSGELHDRRMRNGVVWRVQSLWASNFLPVCYCIYINTTSCAAAERIAHFCIEIVTILLHCDRWIKLEEWTFFFFIVQVLVFELVLFSHSACKNTDLIKSVNFYDRLESLKVQYNLVHAQSTVKPNNQLTIKHIMKRKNLV